MSAIKNIFKWIYLKIHSFFVAIFEGIKFIFTGIRIAIIFLYKLVIAVF